MELNRSKENDSLLINIEGKHKNVKLLSSVDSNVNVLYHAWHHVQSLSHYLLDIGRKTKKSGV